MALPMSGDHELNITSLVEGQQKSGGLIARIVLGSLLVKAAQHLQET